MNPKGTPANLKPFKPGISGNPGGRPKKRPISDRYQARAEKRLPEDLRLMLKLEKGATYGDALALAQFRAAIKGKADAAREVREGIEGKATVRLEHSGPEGAAIEAESARAKLMAKLLPELLTDGKQDA